MKPPADKGSLALGACVYAVLAFIIVPLVIVIPMSFGQNDYLAFPPSGFTLKWYAEYFDSRQWRAATLLSLQVAFLTAICASVIGTAATYAMVRGRSRLVTLFQVLLIGPIIVPHIAIAVGLYLFFQTIGLSGTIPGFVLAHTVLTLPFVVFTMAAALGRVDANLEAAAMSCGATRFAAFRHVTLPLILPSLASGALFAFIISFDEPVVSFFLSGVRQKTLPRRMFEDIEQNLTPIIPAIATLLIVLSIAILLGAHALRSRSKTQ
ncbi:ABC transporter permease [Bradyrhizobium sp. CCGB12]|uniref:ABC transporter permease n=1 Tax=Bradyrhizobium sp. CCGB12 TaxID=2949632 RepID=UPI0020B1C058|nr:ABC transporter permease [Bradyrhizobium sp. CCGB12]MCP3387913.1 ABC transporter permease [Bradyrhizobium sp. CCGB12]